MSTLDKARIKINEIDEQMASLFESRMKAVEEVVQYKVENNMEVLDASREKDLVAKNISYIQNERFKESYQAYFNEMLTISKKYQKRIINKNKIGYGGALGAFSHIASMQVFADHELIAYTTFKEVVDAVEKGDVTYGVIPFENSYTGEVSETSEILRDANVYIRQMHDLKITQNLLGIPKAKLEEIKTIYSHPQGISQCSLFLKGRKIQCIPCPNTALAAQMVQEKQDPSIAAIASYETAQLYHLDIIEEDINTSKENTTRFIVVHKEMIEEGNAFQMLFTTKNETGALANAINCVANHKFNMNSIKSKAIPNQPWSYYFHVELEGNLASKDAKEMLKELATHCTEVKILGGYTKKEG